MLVAAFVAACMSGGCTVHPAGSGSAPAATAPEGGRLTGTVVAGPTCPVVTEPPQSGCGDRAVAGAGLIVVDAAGERVARLTSAPDGSFAAVLPPGRYRLLPQPVQGLMGTAPAQDFTIGENTTDLTVTYDTGIR